MLLSHSSSVIPFNVSRVIEPQPLSPLSCFHCPRYRIPRDIQRAVFTQQYGHVCSEYPVAALFCTSVLLESLSLIGCAHSLRDHTVFLRPRTSPNSRSMLSRSQQLHLQYIQFTSLSLHLYRPSLGHFLALPRSVSLSLYEAAPLLVLVSFLCISVFSKFCCLSLRALGLDTLLAFIHIITSSPHHIVTFHTEPVPVK